jgi:hypothetical protein
MSEQMIGVSPEDTPGKNHIESEDKTTPESEEKKGSISGEILNVANFANKDYETLKMLTIRVNRWQPNRLLSSGRDYPEINVVFTFDQASGIKVGEEPLIDLDITDKGGIEGATWVSQEVINSLPK